MRRTQKLGIAALASLALVVTACGSSDDGGSTTTSAPATSAAATTGGDTSAAGETSPAESSAEASGGDTSAAETTGGGGGGDSELVVWADNSANTGKAIEPLCKQWAEENGVTCTVRMFNGGTELQNALIQGNSTGDVPDVFEGPHDQIGRFQQNGILAPVDLGANTDKFIEASVQGVTYNGATVGVPWAMENIALLTNKALSPECPATLDEAVDNATKLIADGKVQKGLGIGMQIGATGDGYHWYPLFSADGGYAFKQNPDGTFDPKDMGIGSEGGIAAAERLQQLVKDGIFGANVSFDIAKEAFVGGESPYWITGPWAIPDAAEALGDDLTVCAIPDWEGSEYQSQPFIGVRAFFQPNNAKNPVLASTFLSDEVQTTEFMDAMFAVDPRPPAWKESFDKAAEDPYVKAFGDYGAKGIPMPSIPQMSNVFEDWGLAEFNVANGADPKATMEKAAESINQRNASLN